MRIAIISNYRIGSESGVAKVSENLSQQLSQKHQVLYICLGEKYKFQKKSKNLHYLKLPSFPIKQGYIARITPQIIEKFNRDLDKFSPDIIHAQNIVFSALLALLWAREEVPYIVTFHSIPTNGLIWLYPQLAKDKAIKAIDYSLQSSYVNRFLKHCSLVIALNKTIYDSVTTIHPRAKIKIINNGINLKPYFNLKINKPGRKINFIYMGSYMSKKNQEFLVKTFKHLPNNYVLYLHGNIQTGRNYVEKLKKILKEENISNVKIGNFLRQKQLLKKIEKSTYFVSASLKEVQSLAVIEALAAGKPVIALKNETINEVINNKNGLKLPQNTTPKKFAEEIKKYIVKNKENYNQISNYCRKSVARFNEKEVVKKLIATYEEVIKSPIKKRKNKMKIYGLIPKRFKKILPKKFFTKKQKNTELNSSLFLTIFLSILANGVFSTLKWLRTKKN